ncbi:MAG: helix-turn-helix transcriptional regulator [Rhizobiaceae bacterium]
MGDLESQFPVLKGDKRHEPSLSFAPPLVSAPVSSGCPSGIALREARRSRGLSQTDLAHLLNISQSRVSAWERGYDEVPNRVKLRLVDILTNKRGVLNPLLNRLIKSNPSIAIYTPETTDGHPDFRWVHMADQRQPRFLCSNNDYLGERISNYFDLQWCQKRPNLGMARDNLMVDVERDVTTTDAFGAQCLGRRRSRQIFLEFEGYPQLVLTFHSDYTAATGAPPVMHGQLFLDELER